MSENREELPQGWSKATAEELEAKYKEPIAPDTTNLQPLPEGWCWVSFGQVTWQLRSGTAQTAIRQKTSCPVLKSSAVRPGSIDFNDVNYFSEDGSAGSGSILEEGDILVTRLSGSVEYVGSCAVVQHQPTGDIRYPDRIFCGKLAGETNGRFIAHCFEHPRLRAAIERAAKSTAGHQRISLSDLNVWMLPLPLVAEQEAIVEVVEDQLSVIDHLEADIDVKLKSAQALRQSILRRAFSGKLVPQDPNDEPASKLLKRIAAGRAARTPAAASRKQSRARKSRKVSGEAPISRERATLVNDMLGSTKLRAVKPDSDPLHDVLHARHISRRR